MSIALYGYITWYMAISDADLYCGGRYDLSQAWLALPVEMYESREARCGDLFAVWAYGDLRYLRALDAGGFGDYCVLEGGGCVPIVADVPRHVFRGRYRATRGYVINSQPCRDRLERER